MPYYTREIRAKAPRSAGPDDLLSISEVQEATGTSRRFVELQLKEGTLSSFRIGRRMIRIRRSELSRWLASYEADETGARRGDATRTVATSQAGTRQSVVGASNSPSNI